MIILTGRVGQLGNRLTLFAHFIALAIEAESSLLNLAFDEYAAFFEATNQDLFCRFPCRKSSIQATAVLRKLVYFIGHSITLIFSILRINGRRFRNITLDKEEMFDLSRPEFVESLRERQLLFVQGWAFRCHAYVTKHAEKIREFFQPVEPHRQNVARLINRARTDCDVLIGVHVRHGDYKEFAGGKYFYQIEEYAQVMERILNLFPARKVTFLVCSNVGHTLSQVSKARIIRGTGHLVEDMYSLAQCDYIIGPPSTFSLWASFYGDKPIYFINDIHAEIRLEDFKKQY